MSPLEAMAKAHWQTNAEDLEFLPQWDELTNPRRCELINQMRAALIALRDCGVTADMYIACRRSGLEANRAVMYEAMRAMLDAAIAEGP